MEKHSSRRKRKLRIAQGLFLIVSLVVSSQATGQNVTHMEEMSERIHRISSPNKGAAVDIFIDKKIIGLFTYFNSTFK